MILVNAEHRQKQLMIYFFFNFRKNHQRQNNNPSTTDTISVRVNITLSSISNLPKSLAINPQFMSLVFTGLSICQRLLRIIPIMLEI